MATVQNPITSPAHASKYGVVAQQGQLGALKAGQVAYWVRMPNGATVYLAATDTNTAMAHGARAMGVTCGRIGQQLTPGQAQAGLAALAGLPAAQQAQLPAAVQAAIAAYLAKQGS